MAKKSVIETNNRRKRMVESYALKREKIKKEFMRKDISVEERFGLMLRFSKLPRNSSPVRIRNRCALTGRPRGFYSRFGLSRIALRSLANERQIPGIVRSSW